MDRGAVFDQMRVERGTVLGGETQRDAVIDRDVRGVAIVVKRHRQMHARGAVPVQRRSHAPLDRLGEYHRHRALQRTAPRGRNDVHVCAADMRAGADPSAASEWRR